MFEHFGLLGTEPARERAHHRAPQGIGTPYYRYPGAGRSRSGWILNFFGHFGLLGAEPARERARHRAQGTPYYRYPGAGRS